ncbi:MAG TPA: hypothetical protein DCL08_02625 [Anaerolineaceae bacterium]|jgi:hypothetical protein|nr:hypothetical protein [Anaerolineaceae bacterium]
MQAPILRQSGLKVKAVTHLTSLYRIVYLTSPLNESCVEKTLINLANYLQNLPITTELLLGCELARQPKITPLFLKY